MKFAQSMCMKHVKKYLTDFHKIIYWRILQRIIELSQFSLMLDKSDISFAWWPSQNGQLFVLHGEVTVTFWNLFLSHNRIKNTDLWSVLCKWWELYLVNQDWWCEIIIVIVLNVLSFHNALGREHPYCKDWQFLSEGNHPKLKLPLIQQS
jgi:hypothetical protein